MSVPTTVVGMLVVYVLYVSLSAYLLTSLLAYLLAYMLAYLIANLLAHMLVYLFNCLIAYRVAERLFSSGILIFDKKMSEICIF